MKCESLFSVKKNKKKYLKLTSVEIFTQHAIKAIMPDEQKGSSLDRTISHNLT